MPELIEEKFDIEASDDDIVETFTRWFKESETFHDHIKRSQDKVERYYLGNQTDRDIIPEHLSNTVENRIFEGTETVVPVVTANAHQFVVLPGSENELSMKKAENLHRVLQRKYETLRIQEKLENATRKMILYRFGILKWGWNDIKDDVDVWEIDPRLIYIPKLQVNPNEEIPYVIEKQQYSYNEMKMYFPDVDISDVTEYDKSSIQKRLYKVYEVWTDEMVAWISSKIVLEKRANPYWDWQGEEKLEIAGDFLPGKKRPRKKTKLIFRNHLDQPRKPFVFLTTYNIGEGPVADISLAEVSIPIQDAINVESRQIIDNLRRMGNGRVLVDEDAMVEERSDSITNEPGLIIRGERVASENKVRFEAGTPLPSSHFAHYQNMRAAFDNLFGVHSATRGQAQAKTLGQDILSRQQDFTRIDLITRVINRGVDYLVNGLVQLMKMYYTEPHVTKYLGEGGAVEFIRLVQDDIEDHIEIWAKSGASPVFDKIQLANQATQLWQLQALDPVTLYERLDFPDPEKTAERLAAWKTGQLTQETQARIIEAQAGAQAKAQTQGEGGTQGRGVEQPLNVLQRAAAQMGGLAPVAPGTPNL